MQTIMIPFRISALKSPKLFVQWILLKEPGQFYHQESRSIMVRIEYIVGNNDLDVDDWEVMIFGRSM